MHESWWEFRISWFFPIANSIEPLFDSFSAIWANFLFLQIFPVTARWAVEDVLFAAWEGRVLREKCAREKKRGSLGVEYPIRPNRVVILCHIFAHFFRIFRKLHFWRDSVFPLCGSCTSRRDETNAKNKTQKFVHTAENGPYWVYLKVSEVYACMHVYVYVHI